MSSKINKNVRLYYRIFRCLISVKRVNKEKRNVQDAKEIWKKVVASVRKGVEKVLRAIGLMLSVLRDADMLFSGET